MTTHLAHKLPWEAVHDIYMLRVDPRIENGPGKVARSAKQAKKLDHFVRCLTDTLKDFAETDKSSEQDREIYDPKTWGNEHWHGRGAWLGFYETVLCGYIEINLILLDANGCLPRMMRNGRKSWIQQTLPGECDGGHPEEFASHFRQVFDDDVQQLKLPLTADTLQILKDHAAMLFRAMYSTSGENEFLDPEVVKGKLNWLM